MKRAPSPRPDWIELCSIEHASGERHRLPDHPGPPGAPLGRQPRLHRPEPVVRALRRRRPAGLPALRPRPGSRARRSTKVLESALLVREALDALGMPVLREDDRLAGNSRLRPDRPRADAEAGVDVRQGVRAGARRAEPEARHRGVQDREAPEGPGARRLQPERVGADARVDLLGAAQAAGDGLDAGDVEGDRERRRDRGLPHGQRAGRGSRRSAICGSRCSPTDRRGSAWRSSRATLDDACRSRRRIPPMEALLGRRRSPTGRDWQYEPKWDGFRCLAFRDGDRGRAAVEGGAAARRATSPRSSRRSRRSSRERFVLDGEIVDPGRALRSRSTTCSSASIRRRAASRSSRDETPAIFIVFDLLVDDDGPVAGRACRSRSAARCSKRSRGAIFRKAEIIRLSPATDRRRGREEVVRPASRQGHARRRHREAARPRLPLRAGGDGMQKIKRMRTADCVVGGFRYGSKATRTSGRCCSASTTTTGLLHHVGFSLLVHRRRTRPSSRRRSSCASRSKAAAASPAGRRAGRAAGAPSAPASGSRSSRARRRGRSTTTSPAAASATARSSCAGGRTRRRSSARWTRSRRRGRASPLKLLEG